MSLRVYQLLMLAMFLGGAACVGWDAAGSPGALADVKSWGGLQAGVALLLVSSAMGFIAVSLFVGDVGRLCKGVSALGSERGGVDGSVLEPPRREMMPVVEAVQRVMRAAEQSVEDAELRVKELEIQFKVANAERQHAEAIIYSISDAVLVTDVFDELVMANDSAAKTFGFELSESARWPIQQVLRDPKMIDLIRGMRESSEQKPLNGSEGGETRREGGRRVVEHRLRTPMGERVYKITLSPVGMGDGRSEMGDGGGGVVAVLHDMTREKEVAQIKSDFVSHVSHELRTPLASIKAYVEMLIDGEAEDEKTQQEFFEVIQNEANRLSRLIDNILNISRIESGLVQVNKQAVSLPGIIADAVEVIQPQARMKQIKLEEQLTPAFYQVLADRDMLYQAVMNLLSNAVKYTPEGGSVTVVTDVDEESRKVVVRIRDTGVGIPPKDLPFVFDKFYRVESNNRVAKGTGLGLSLVKHIVENVHQGRIWVESDVGKGSCFSFELEMCG